VYFERCLTPASVELLGSGGRAAAALSNLTDITLHTFFPDRYKEDVLSNFNALNIETHIHPSTDVVEFHYHFPLSSPRFAPSPLPTANAAKVAGENIIRFGCVEGELIVEGSMAVYDPQSGSAPQPFGQNGSKADRLAMVLNENEIASLSKGDNLKERVNNLTDRPEVVIVKSGPSGAHVFQSGEYSGHIPIYRSNSVYKIGSGDIFTAMFAYNWCEKELDALHSADEASRYVAHYVENRSKQMPEHLPEMEPIVAGNSPKKVYLAGSFFSTEHIWLIEEAYAALRALHIPIFSPYHDVGLGTGKEIAEADLAGLSECSVLFALISDRDPGTMLEIGYALANGKKVIVFSENPGPQDLTMVTGAGCAKFCDLATAIYNVAWEAMT